MNDPIRSKLKVVLYISLALALSLGLASAFRMVQGGVAAPVTAVASVNGQGTTETLPETGAPTTEGRVRSVPQIPANLDALAEVSQVFVSIAEAVTPAVVSVDTRGQPRRQALPRRFDDLFGPFEERAPETQYDVPLGRGSGFLVSDKGYILTNNHVVAGAERILVELPDGRRFAAELVGRDPTTDVAVLKIEGENFPTVKLGDSEAAAVGEFALAIGNPGTEFGSALPFTVTAGIISAKGRSLGIIRAAAGDTEFAIEDLIQTDAVINPGNSGGPLVNHRGEVIGMNTAIASTTGYYQGYGFAIPISLAKDVMDDLIEYGRVRRAALGVQVLPVTPEDVQAYKLPELAGAVVQDFPDDSPGRDAGIQRGDVIVAVDGKAVRRVGQLQRLVASYDPGDKIKVEAIRKGKRMTFNVRLAEVEVPLPEVASSKEAERPATTLLGIQVRSLDPEDIRQAGLDVDELQGVLVTRVAQFGPAWNAGLDRGWVIQTVNGERVTSVDEFDDALSDVSPGDVVSLDAVRVGADRRLSHRIFNIGVPES